MATVKRFEDLLSWQKARDLVRLIYLNFKSVKDPGFTDQIQRAAVSVMSNIAEGFESGTRDEFVNYLFIAKGSAGEVRAQLYAAFDIGYLNLETFKSLKGLAEKCSKLLATFTKGVKGGAMAGLQRKREYKEDPHTLYLREQGYVQTANGLKQRVDATKLGIEFWEVGTPGH